MVCLLNMHLEIVRSKQLCQQETYRAIIKPTILTNKTGIATIRSLCPFTLIFFSWPGKSTVTSDMDPDPGQ